MCLQPTVRKLRMADDKAPVSLLLNDCPDSNHLLPLFPLQSTPLFTTYRLTGSFNTPLPGLIGVLPPEVLGTIVDALLALHPYASLTEANASAKWVRNFMLTCRGAGASASRAQLLEMVARRNAQITLARGTQSDQPYYTLALRILRSCMELDAMLVGIHEGIAHCASLTGGCCRGARNRFNDNMHRNYYADPNTGRGTLALEAMGPGRTHMCVKVAGGQDKQIMCETDHGVAIHTRIPGNKSCLVQCVEGGAPDAFCPESELKVTFTFAKESLDGWFAVARAASGGDLLVLLVVLAYGATPRDSTSNLQLQTWDTRQNKLIDTRPVTEDVDRLWVCNDTVHRLCSPDGDEHRVFIDSYRPRTSSTDERVHLPRISRMRTLYFAKRTGDIAFVSPTTNCCAEEVLFMDMRLRRIASIDVHDERHVNGGLSRIALSPAGDTIVYLAWALNNPGVFVYRRDADYDTARERLSAPFGWRLTNKSYMGTCSLNSSFASVEASLAFSPCGSKVCCFFASHGQAECMWVDLRRTFAVRNTSTPVNVNFKSIMLNCHPRAIVWSSDGIYLHTNTLSGFLRIGTL